MRGCPIAGADLQSVPYIAIHRRPYYQGFSDEYSTDYKSALAINLVFPADLADLRR